MESAEHSGRVEISMLGFLSANDTHVKRFMRPKTKHQTLYDHSLLDYLQAGLGAEPRWKVSVVPHCVDSHGFEGMILNTYDDGERMTGAA